MGEVMFGMLNIEEPIKRLRVAWAALCGRPIVSGVGIYRPKNQINAVGFQMENGLFTDNKLYHSFDRVFVQDKYFDFPNNDKYGKINNSELKVWPESVIFIHYMKDEATNETVN